MKHTLFSLLLWGTCISLFAFTFNGVTIPENNEFTKTTMATIAKKATTAPEEISGMACSRTTEGYFWVHSDDGDNKIYALGSDGQTKYTVTLSNVAMRDWEDICIATVGSKNYILLGAFGDNDLVYKDDYYIYRFEEPAITVGGSKSVSVEMIKFGYPSSTAFNAETIMYDPIGNKIYIVNKIKDAINTIFSMPYQESYSGRQTLTKIQDLGRSGEKFNFLTAGDISQDGMYILIKSKTDILYWKRQGTEDLAVTFARNPEHIKAYAEETQGEAAAWNKDASVFYTCSDVKAKDNANPIYQYTRSVPTGEKNISSDTFTIRVQDGQLFIENTEEEKIEIYNSAGQKITSGYSGSINMRNLKGFYIIRVGNRLAKVIF